MNHNVKNKRDEEVPLIYLWIFKKLCDKWGRCNTIVYSKEILEVVRRTIYQVPRKYDYFILKEMEKFQLIENINQQRHKILGSCANKKLKKLDNYFSYW